MADIVTEGSHPDYSPPVSSLLFSSYLRKKGFDVVKKIERISYSIKNPRGYLHHTQLVFKPTVGRPGIHQIAHGQLVYVAKSLNKRRV